ncbi:MAG: hypothetical protein KAI41_10605, partial [Hyphomicrobiaceae bacterium]|nr:hypothetical protein [Hyphomicrobiaceae bacterium]
WSGRSGSTWRRVLYHGRGRGSSVAFARIPPGRANSAFAKGAIRSRHLLESAALCAGEEDG